MKPTKDPEQIIKRMRFSGTDEMDERILRDVQAALEQPRKTPPGSPGTHKWRILMRSKWTKITAVAATLLMFVGLSFVLVDQSTQVAYALEQTVEANREIRTCHIRIDPPGAGGIDERIEEAWAEFNSEGELLRLRMHMAATADGPKQAVWEDGKAEVWLKDKGMVIVIRDTRMLEIFRKMLSLFDPKVAIEKLSADEAEGKVTIKTEEPTADGEPISLVVSSRDKPRTRTIYRVDAETRLLQRIEVYGLKDGEYVLASQHDYLDYNRPIDPSMFVLDTPTDVTRVDQTTQEVGLAKGDLTDEEIAVNVIREFWKALIDKDYDKAGLLMEGVPGSWLKERIELVTFVRIISIGPPEPMDSPGMRGFRVPCEVEVEVNGEKSSWKRRAYVRSVEGQPDRWTISGGI